MKTTEDDLRGIIATLVERLDEVRGNLHLTPIPSDVAEILNYIHVVCRAVANET